MTSRCSPNTQAALLLGAPLLAGRKGSPSEHLSPKEFKALASGLRERGAEPSDLLGSDMDSLLSDVPAGLDRARVRRLLDRGFLLAQALERWGSRTIWVMSRFDAEYPRRLVDRLGEEAPILLYGCGSAAALESGGLAIVGSRNASPELLEYARTTASLAASARVPVISGGARGIDQAAMSGALGSGGHSVGVLADGLERAALDRGSREFLQTERLTLTSPYDPGAGFNVGHAMHRNKLIYALADAALVVSAEPGTGGTWAGALEQLQRLRFVPVYVRTSGAPSSGLEALRSKSAYAWPEPESAEGLRAILQSPASPVDTEGNGARKHQGLVRDAEFMASDEYDRARALFLSSEEAYSEKDVISALQVSRTRTRDVLKRLIIEGVVERLNPPVRYRKASDRLL